MKTVDISLSVCLASNVHNSTLKLTSALKLTTRFILLSLMHYTHILTS